MTKLKPIEYLVPRWEHQRLGEDRAVELYLKEKAEAEAKGTLPSFGFGFFFEPGTGKTMTAINTLRRLMVEEGRFLRTLIFCPPVVCSNWKAEFGKFSRLDQKKIHVLADNGHYRLKKFNSLAFDEETKPRPGIFITNYEGIVGRAGSALDELYHAMVAWAPEVVILDESHYLKDMRSTRTKLIERLTNPSDKKIKKLVPRPAVLELTGTPILNNFMDLFSQFLVMDGGKTFGDNFFMFRARFFEDRNRHMPKQRHFPDWRIKPGAEAKIQELIASRSMSALKKDCLDLPPLIEQTIAIEMSEEQKRLYLEMKQHLITFIESDACVAKLAITKALRLMQIASGFVRTEDGVDVPLKKNPKLEALTELLPDVAASSKTIVWAVFKQNYLDIRNLCNKLKLPFVTLHGGMTNGARNDAIKRFNHDPKCRVLLGHPRSGGIGANLTASNYSFDFSRTFSNGDREQSKARNYRGGSEIHESITHTSLVMKGTIEEKILNSLDQKQEISLSVLRACLGSKSLGGK